MDSNIQIMEQNNVLCEEIENLLKKFTDENMTLYTNRYHRLLDEFNNGKISENGMTLYALAPQLLHSNLEELKEELETKIKNKDGIITNEYKYSKYFNSMLEQCIKRINPHLMNDVFIHSGIIILSEFLLTVDKFLKDDSIQFSIKTKYFEIITDIIILCCASELTWNGYSNWSLIEQLKNFYINNDNDYSTILDFLINEIRNKKFTVKEASFSEILLSKDSLTSANSLISLAIITNYKQVLKKYTEQKSNNYSLQERDRMIFELTNHIQNLGDDELINLYNSLIIEKQKNL